MSASPLAPSNSSGGTGGANTVARRMGLGGADECEADPDLRRKTFFFEAERSDCEAG